MCQDFNHFSGFFPHFVLAKLATSSIRVNILLSYQDIPICILPWDVNGLTGFESSGIYF